MQSRSEQSKAGQIASGSLKVTKNYVIPSVIALGRSLTVAGTALFGMLSAVKLLSKEDDHPAGIYIGIISIIVSIIAFLPTRGLAIFRFFQELGQSSHAADVEEIELSKVGKSLSVGLQTLSYSTLLFNLMNFYLGAITLIDFTSKNAFKKDNHEGNLEYVTQTAAIFLAVCSILSFSIFSVRRAVASSKTTANNLVNLDIPKDRYMAATAALTVLGSAAIPFNNFFQLSSALEKVVFVKDFPKGVKYAFAGYHALSSTVLHLLTQPPAIYRAIKRGNQQAIVAVNKPCFETPLKVILYPTGVVEVGIFTLMNMNGIIQTSNAMFDIDVNNRALLGASVPFATSTALLNFFFTVHEAMKDSVKEYHRKHPVIVEVVDEENQAGNVAVTTPIYKGSRNSQTLFATAEEQEMLLPKMSSDVVPVLATSHVQQKT